MVSKKLKYVKFLTVYCCSPFANMSPVIVCLFLELWGTVYLLVTSEYVFVAVLWEYPYAGWSLHKDTTLPQPNYTVTPTHIAPEQYNTWNKSTVSRKLLKMDVLTFKTCWAVNGEIIKRVTSSWFIFIQLCKRNLNKEHFLKAVWIPKHDRIYLSQ